jgi:hypothetical protein
LQAPDRVPAGLLGSLVILAAVEVFVARSDWIVRRFPATSVGVVAALESDVIEGSEPDVICLGNSRLRDAIAPRVMERELGVSEGKVLNLALTGGTPYDSLVMYRRNSGCLGKARLLIVDFEYHYFARRVSLSPRVSRFATFEDRRRLFRSWHELAPACVGCVWRTFGMREYLRALIVNRPTAGAVVIGDDGRVVWRNPEADSGIDIDRDNAKAAGSYGTDEIDYGYARELQRLIALAKEDGLFVVLLHVPLRQGFVRYLNETCPACYQQCRREFHEMRSGADLIIDWEHGGEIGIGDKEYYDWGHVTDAASRRIGSQIARQLRKSIPDTTPLQDTLVRRHTVFHETPSVN